MGTTVGSRYWSFKKSQPAMVGLSVHALYPDAGAVVVEQARAAVKECTSWVYGGRFTMTPVGLMTITKPTGASDAAVYCQKAVALTGQNKGSVSYWCDGIVSRGHLAADVTTLKLTLAEAQSDMKRALPVAAAALARAVPTP